MGKVQAAFSRLLSRPGPVAELADRLCIPAQQESVDSAPTTHPSAVKDWIVAQEAANSAGTRKGHQTSVSILQRALLQSNRTLCDAETRIQIMHEYRKPFIRAMQSLDLRYQPLDLPLFDETENAFQLATMLCHEMASGYKIAIADSLRNHTEKKKRFSRSSRQTARLQRCQSIKMALTYLTHRALRYSQVNRDWPDDLWRDLNTLADIAISDNTFDIVTQDENSTDHSISIHQQYAALCALSIFDQKNLSAENLQSLLVKLGRLAGDISFHSSRAAASNAAESKAAQSKAAGSVSSSTKPVIYSVGTSSAPSVDHFRIHQPGDRLRYFSIDSIAAGLHSEDSVTALNSAMPAVMHRPPRKHQRTPSSAKVSAEIGLADIHQRLRQCPPQEHTASQFTDLHQLIANENVTARSTPADSNTHLLDQTNTPACSDSFLVNNQSRGGFGMTWQGAGSSGLQIGELIAHSYTQTEQASQHTAMHTSISWHISVVRWLRTTHDGKLHLGVEALSRHARSVECIRWSKPYRNSQKTTDALLINYQPLDSKARMLILPKHNYMAGETIAYRDGQSFRVVKLIESVALSDCYQCFATQEIEQESTDPLATDYAASDHSINTEINQRKEFPLAV